MKAGTDCFFGRTDTDPGIEIKEGMFVQLPAWNALSIPNPKYYAIVEDETNKGSGTRMGGTPPAVFHNIYTYAKNLYVIDPLTSMKDEWYFRFLLSMPEIKSVIEDYTPFVEGLKLSKPKVESKLEKGIFNSAKAKIAEIRGVNKK